MDAPGEAVRLKISTKSQKKKRAARVSLNNLEVNTKKQRRDDGANLRDLPKLTAETSTPPPATTGSKVEFSGNTESLDAFLNNISDVGYIEPHAVDSDNDEADESNAPLSGFKHQQPKNKLEKISADISNVPFTKVLYENSELRTNSVYRTANGISIEGDADVPPITHWYQAGLTLPLINVIERCKYAEPTPVQAQSLPILMSGHDLLAIAPTGCGKTVAFSIPLCRHIAANRDAYRLMGNGKNRGGPYGIVLVPTRELCLQIKNELDKFAQALGISVLGCYGGVDISVQISQIIKSECNIIVATPGRLIDLLAANGGRVLTLRSVTFLVIDETDRMFDLGFGPQVRKILSVIRPDRQTAVFSATMSGAMEQIVKRILANPIKVIVGVKSTVPKHVQQSAMLLSKQDNKFSKLVEILRSETTESNSSTIIFVNTQNLADELALQLIKEGFKCQALHGGMDQRDRDETMNAFKRGNLPILVATSVAARGLDVNQLKLVINYDPASHIEDYVHRAGRTGRAGNAGKCVTFLDQYQKRQAYELSQLFDVDAKIKKLADQYKEYLDKQQQKPESDDKSSQTNSTEQFKQEMYGFVGHGLSKLDKRRELHKSIEHDVYQEGTTNSNDLANVVKKVGNNYYAILMINDIPRGAKTAVTAVQKHNSIAENNHVSITLKGQYIAKAKRDTPDSEKLHLQIDGNAYENVASAYTQLLAVVDKHMNAEHGSYSKF